MTLIDIRAKSNSNVCQLNNTFETGGAMPTKIGMHALDINPYLHEFFERILSD